VFVVDKSGSMEGSKLDTAKQQLPRRHPTSSPTATRIGVVFFDNTLWKYPTNDAKLVTPVGLESAIRSQLRRHDRAAGRPRGPALKAAARSAHATSCSCPTDCERRRRCDDLISLAAEYGHRGIRIDTVGVGDDTRIA